MRKVLIIGYFWPYRRGSKRVIGLAKYLPEFGWEPVILTGPLNRKPDLKVRYIEVEYRNIFGFKAKIDFSDRMGRKIKDTPPFFKNFLRNVFKYIGEVIAYPDEYKYWKPSAVKAVEDILKKEKIDAIISIWPVTSHLIAKELKNKYKIPWVADYPDLWSQNQDYPYSFLRRIIDKWLEKRTLFSADIITVVTKPWVDSLKKIHQHKIICSITHGFDPDTVNQNQNNLTKKFTITYTGQIYAGRQDAFKILLAAKDLISDETINQQDIEVRFFGPFKEWLAKKIRKLNLESVARQYGEIPKKESLHKQKESQILLLLNWEDPKGKGVCPGKIFEYLAARRPILASGGFGSDVIEELLQETRAGVYARTVEEIKNSLYRFYSEYKQKGKISYKGNWEEIKKYSHREMAKKFADILNKITE